MLIAWIIGIILNIILIYVWNHCYIEEDDEYTGCRIPVNILVVILFIVLALTPIINIISAISFAIIFISIIDDYYIEWRFPKWMTKKIK